MQQREIKFRVWNQIFGMSEPETLRDMTTFIHQKDGVKLLESEYPKDSIFMQYTGLKDKNGKEIYEGDILSCHEEKANYPLNYIVVFNQEESGFKLRWIGHKNTEFYDRKISASGFKVFEVIGNIYENPDLLK